MNKRGLILLFASALLSAGCQRDAYLAQHIEQVNGEKRLLEDEYYRLEYDYDVLADEFDELKEQNGELKRRLGVDGGEDVPGVRVESLPDRGPRIESPDTPIIDVPEGPMEIPGELPFPSGTPAPFPEGAAAAHFEPANELRPFTPPADLRVTHIMLNPALTHGHDFDRKPGDDGIAVVVEPRNADDAFVPVPGEVSIVVIDPAQTGEAQRVARWDFAAAETEHRIRTEMHQQGLHFKLPWPGQRPGTNHLMLFVRLTTDDGRTLQTSGELNVAREGEFSERWTPKPDAGRGRDREGNSIMRPTPAAPTILKSESPAPAGQAKPPAINPPPSALQAPTPAAAELPLPEWTPYR